MATKTRPGTAPTKPVVMRLVGEDGNAFFIMGKLTRALKNAGADKVYIEDVMADMRSGDYAHLLGVAMDEIDTEERRHDDSDDD